MQQKCSALERIRIGRPIVAIKKKREKRNWPTAWIGDSRCDVPQESREIVDRAKGTKRREIGVVVEEKSAAKARKVDKPCQHQADDKRPECHKSCHATIYEHL